MSHAIRTFRAQDLVRSGACLVILAIVLFASCGPIGQAARAQEATTTIFLPTVRTAPKPRATNLPDGDFELGGGWIEDRGYNGRPLIVQAVPGLPAQPHSGRWFAWLGGDHLLGETRSNQSRITYSQFIQLPTTGPITLRAFYQIFSVEQPNIYGVCDRDLINIWIDNILIYQGQVCELTQTNGWTEAQIDISSFAGDSVALQFELRTNAELLSHVLIDDVSIEAPGLSFSCCLRQGFRSRQAALQFYLTPSPSPTPRREESGSPSPAWGQAQRRG
jgi:hypothetical protein